MVLPLAPLKGELSWPISREAMTEGLTSPLRFAQHLPFQGRQDEAAAACVSARAWRKNADSPAWAAEGVGPYNSGAAKCGVGT